MPDREAQRVTYVGFYGSETRPLRGVVPAEGVITLEVNGEPLVRLMCTPTRLEDLAVGFLFNEGLIRGMDEVAVVELCGGGDGVAVWLEHGVDAHGMRSITSGCSGGTTFEDLRAAQHKIESAATVTPAQVTALMEGLADSASLHRRAGGVHAAALTDGDGGELVCLAEDVGRHNTLDKIAGSCLRRGIATPGGVLLTSGRVSSEMVNKAAHMEVPIIISRTSPTGLSIELAEAWGMTLVGYTRRKSFRVYAGEERIVAESSSR